MGFSDLWVAAPRRDGMMHDPQAIAMASGATDLLASMHQTDSLSQALAPVTLAFALTARARDLGPPSCDIRAAARMAREHLNDQANHHVAIVLGCERAGLS